MKFIHTADTHLGYQQYHKQERKADFFDAFDAIITDAIEKNVDGVIHGGDLFHRSRPDIETLSRAFSGLKRLQENGIEFYMVVGNHDGTRDKQWSELIEDLDIGVYLGKDGCEVGDSVVLFGQDHVSKNRRNQLTYPFSGDESDTNILVAHGLFSEFEYGDWSLEQILEQSRVGFDAALLGDNHKSSIKHVNEVPATYPGSSERTAADQREQRGYNVVTIEDGISIKWEGIDTRTFEYIDLEMEPRMTADDVISEIESRDIEDGCVLIVTLTGDGQRVNVGDIERAGGRVGALVVQVNDRREFERESEENTFDEIEFVDPDEEVENKLEQIDVSATARELEELARDTSVPRSKLKDESENMVEMMVDADGFVESVKNDDDIELTVTGGDDEEKKQLDFSDVGGEQ